MTAALPSAGPPRASRIGRLSSWLHRPSDAPATVARRDADRRLYGDVGAFLDAHDLSPTPDHFRIVRAHLLGEDVGLSRAIDDHLARHDGITASDLEAFAAVRPGDALHPDRIARLADALAARLAESELAFRQSHTSVRDYESALTAEVDAAARDPGGTVERLLSLTSAAIARAQQLADRLQQTHGETERLRGHLQAAQRAASEDHLTGLPNRRCFDTRLQALAVAADDPPHSVALCDIDDFKAINDRHGHDTGDRVLKLIARHLTAELGVGVLVARHGGEEFACLFEDSAPDHARALLDDVRATLARRTLVNQASGEGIGRLTFSAGVAVLGGDPAAAMRQADAALYSAKRDGKDRVAIAS
ncbi:GGDEF domain-containing protein [Sphingomonas sp. A2-49]|uniref:GGDEF domain-containing protein n=1 Tax=Sphingomonas sp. A2-49 TaxID=1391375 RepID=UPI0021D2C33E|nr:GGDEF domain-containing protein [Sphingomonas sp. A2-49]MCU6454384.1 GGDEF domain-containing protein [Sphingomonas sp. A2-49]